MVCYHLVSVLVVWTSILRHQYILERVSRLLCNLHSPYRTMRFLSQEAHPLLTVNYSNCGRIISVFSISVLYSCGGRIFCSLFWEALQLELVVSLSWIILNTSSEQWLH